MTRTVMNVVRKMLLALIMGFLFSILLCGYVYSSDSGVASTDVGNPDIEEAAKTACSAQKNPFQQYAPVLLLGLDDNFDQTGAIFVTKTSSDKRDFLLPANLNSPYVMSATLTKHGS